MADRAKPTVAALNRPKAPIPTKPAPVYKPGCSEGQILNRPKGSRPHPETYLDQQYAANHLKQFDNGATRFVVKDNFDAFGPAQKDGTAFVLPKGEADQMLAAAGGNKRALEQSLGLPDKFLDSDDLVRVDISDPKALKLRMPSGNEAGANSKWLPGGKLPNGDSEAIIDLGSAPEGAYTSTQLKF